jgi:hypothetical protein
MRQSKEGQRIVGMHRSSLPAYTCIVCMCVILPAGGAMSIAAKSTQALATLWTIVPYANNWGSLYAYTLDPYDGSLAYLWDTYNPTPFSQGGPHKCTWSLGGNSPASGWIATAFTEPTLADNQQGSSNYGAVYVPTVCVITDPTGKQYASCADAAKLGYAASGVAVLTNCPDN